MGCAQRERQPGFSEKKNHTEVTFILIKQMSNWRLLNRCSRAFCLILFPPPLKFPADSLATFVEVVLS